MNKRSRIKNKLIRKELYSKQECWDLYVFMAKDIMMALKSFKKYNVNSYPADLDYIEEWHNIIDKMIYSFEIIANDNIVAQTNQKEEIQEGLDLFAKYFMDLWD